MGKIPIHELNDAFSSGKIFSATDEELNTYLQHLASDFTWNEMVRNREMNRCQIINTIKTFRLIDKLGKKNEELQRSNKGLTRIALVIGVGSLVLSGFTYWQAQNVAKDSGEQLDRWMAIQKSHQEKLLHLEEQQLKVLQTTNSPNKPLNQTRKIGAPVS